MNNLKGLPVLVVGADGHIGHALSNELRSLGADLFETTRKTDSVGGRRLYLDLLTPVEEWEPPKPVQVSFVCAGVTKLMSCEQHPSDTSRINVVNTLSLIRQLLDTGSRVVYLSTGLVLDGQGPLAPLDAEFQPSCEYSRQKAKVERTLLEWNEEKVAILRMTKVLSPEMALIKEWIQCLSCGVSIHPFSDLVMAPIHIDYLINILIRIATSESQGVFQVSGDRDISYADAAAFIAKKLGLDKELVQPITSKEGGIKLISSPSYTTLNAKRVQAEFGVEPANVWNSIIEAFSLWR